MLIARRQVIAVWRCSSVVTAYGMSLYVVPDPFIRARINLLITISDYYMWGINMKRGGDLRQNLVRPSSKVAI